MPNWVYDRGMITSEKEWEAWAGDSCPECGGSLEVLTSAGTGSCYDGDLVRCMDCPMQTGMSVDEDGNAWVEEA